MKYFKEETAKITCYIKVGERKSFVFKVLAVWQFELPAIGGNL